MHNRNASGGDPAGGGTSSVEMEVSGAAVSPFDRIRHVDENGEYWLARELMILLGYAAWRNFEEAIERAIVAINNSGIDAAQHACRLQQAVAGGVPGTMKTDYRLTRFGAYMTAQNGDVRKARVAEAQTYFSVKSREAEIAAATPSPSFTLDNLKALDPETLVALGQLGQALTQTSQALIAEKAINARQAKALEVAESKADYVDTFVDPAADNTLFRTFCNQIQAPEQKLRAHLMNKGILYKKWAGKRYSKSKEAWIDVYEYHAHAGRKAWFHPVDQVNAPRLHNRQLQTTLYVTPVGKVGIKKWLDRNPIEGAR